MSNADHLFTTDCWDHDLNHGINAEQVHTSPQHDRVACHSTNTSQERLQGHDDHPKALHLSPGSPDPNPIKHSCGDTEAWTEHWPHSQSPSHKTQGIPCQWSGARSAIYVHPQQSPVYVLRALSRLGGIREPDVSSMLCVCFLNLQLEIQLNSVTLGTNLAPSYCTCIMGRCLPPCNCCIS